MSKRNKYAKFQLIRDVCGVCTLVCLALAWFYLAMRGDHVLATAWFETGLILIIAGECYARD